ncbi:MAG: hypothetical protein IT518_18090 [Burkholderiales bacterium]|nr:hypothetical protein [Burkholderiales bacterium]
MRAHDAAPKGCSTFGRGLIERERRNSSTPARIREARRLRDRAKLEDAWRAITGEVLA